MQKLYVAMVGLPARGKSTLAKRIRDGLVTEGIAAKLFNNGDMRRALIGAESTDPNFYDPNNKLGREAREMICMRNMEIAREWLAKDGEVAILDATNVSRARRHLIETTLTDYPVLFVECVNEDQLLLNACIRRKTTLPEYASYTEEEALASFMGAGVPAAGRSCNSATATCTSRGMSTSTGPGRSPAAMAKASGITRSSSSMERTIKLCLVAGMDMSRSSLTNCAVIAIVYSTRCPAPSRSFVNA